MEFSKAKSFVIGGGKMSYLITIYKVEEDDKKECNVVAFFRTYISSKYYVIIESPDYNDGNTLIPFLVDGDKDEQKPQLIKDDFDKKIIEQYCENENLEDKNIDFSCSEDIEFLAILDLKSMKLMETIHSMPIEQLLNRKKALDVDKIVEGIDEKKIEDSLKGINENIPKSAEVFLKDCINVNKYDLWLNKKIEEAKNKISKFSNLDIFLPILNQLKTFQTLISLLLDHNKEKHTIEDVLVDFISFSEENELNLTRILENKAMQAFVSENDRKILYGTIVFRISSQFSPKTVNAVANYFYKEKDFGKAVKLFDSLIERYKITPEDIDLVETYNSIGCCYVEMMMFDAAYKAFELAIKTDSTYAIAHNNWAYTLAVECDVIPKNSIWEEKLREALRHINRAIQYRNNDVSFYSNKACIDYELSSFQEVIEDYNDAVSISSNYKELKTILTLKIYSQIELHCAKKQIFKFSDFLNDLETIFKNETGRNKYLFQALDVYYKIRNNTDKSDEICLKLMVFEFIVDRLMSSLAIRDLRQNIYFYTSLSSLQRLLEDDGFKQPIFCANHMNDPNEGQELYKTFLKQVDNKELIYDVFQKIEGIDEMSQRHRLNFEFTFLKAFTENDDSLPMWIHYGDKGRGCCVKVNPRFFSNFTNDSDTEEKNLGRNPFDDEYRLYKVLYLKEGALPDNIDPEIKKLYESFVDLFKDLCLQYVGYSSQLRKAVSSSILKIINSIIYLFKNTDYAYEKEMRIVLRRSISDFEREDIDIQITNPTENNPIPKVFVYAKKPLEIEEVILGPKQNEIDDFIPYIAMRLLKLNNYQEDKVHITKSLIEYR